MADMLLCDHLEELWMLIHQQHLLYLISDESSGKIDQRDKLENYIKEYLCIAPHTRKFTLPQTAQVLHNSAYDRENFSGYKAAVAWKAIGKYADNLVMQPWRKEYKDLKLYCGFYKHEIEENLIDASLMFEAMGYCHAGNSTMAIADILDPDRITSVSKDAIMAYVECQILKQIWESLSPHYNFSWFEILEFRENHTGTPDQAVRALMYKRRQRQFEEQEYRRAQYQTLENHSRPDFAYGNNMTYLNHMHYSNHSYPYSMQPRFGSGINAQHIVSPNSIYPPQIHPVYGLSSAIKPQDLYPPNGYHMQSHYPSQVSSQTLHDCYSNHSNYHSGHNMQQSSVPTAQLIEFDSSPGFNNYDSNSEKSQNNMKYLDEERWQDFDKGSFPSGKAKDDGAGSWENWDYVYRNLESQGYNKKNVSSRKEAHTSKTNSGLRNNSSDSDYIMQKELTDKMKKVNIGITSDNSKLETDCKKANETDDEIIKEKGNKIIFSSAIDISNEQERGKKYLVPDSKANLPSPEKGKNLISSSSSSGGSLTTANYNKISNIQKKENNLEKINAEISVKKLNTFEDKSEDWEEKWECITCTYLNSNDKQICEMCCKSRERGDESVPQPSGGQVCHNCTLVNEPGRNFCRVCDKALKDSPTYI